MMIATTCLALLPRCNKSTRLRRCTPHRLILQSVSPRRGRRRADPTIAAARGFSSSTPSTINSSKTTTNNSTSTAPTQTSILDEEPEIVLYERKTNPSFTLMRSGLALSTFHTGYWIWYNTEFIPLVNQAAMQELHIDPILGYGGLALAVVVNLAFAVFPKRLVSKLGYRPRSQKIVVYTHRLPIVRPAQFPSASFPVGSSSLTTTAAATTTTAEGADEKPKYFKLNKQSVSQIASLTAIKDGKKNKDVFVELGTDFIGVLSAGTSQPLYTIQIQGPKDVPEPELLLEALMRPETFDLFSQEEDEYQRHHESQARSPSRRFRARPKRKKSAAGRRRR